MHSLDISHSTQDWIQNHGCSWTRKSMKQYVAINTSNSMLSYTYSKSVLDGIYHEVKKWTGTASEWMIIKGRFLKEHGCCMAEWGMVHLEGWLVWMNGSFERMGIWVQQPVKKEIQLALIGSCQPNPAYLISDAGTGDVHCSQVITAISCLRNVINRDFVYSKDSILRNLPILMINMKAIVLWPCQQWQLMSLSYRCQ